MGDNVVVHNLRTGIPMQDASVDAVYHSHMLEHIDRGAVDQLFEEVRRVLRRGGVHRIVVPDLERYARSYIVSLEASLRADDARPRHDEAVAVMIEQMVRRESAGTSSQAPLQRWLENLLLGDARRRGETHMWMWDRINLVAALEDAGFTAVEVVDHETSAIPRWGEIGLDLASDGVAEYKPGSLYVESRR